MARLYPSRHSYVSESLDTEFHRMDTFCLLNFDTFCQEYNATIDFYWSPLILESNSDNPIIHRVEYRIIRAEKIEKHASQWSNADILVFNSYLWWRKQKADMRMKVM